MKHRVLIADDSQGQTAWYYIRLGLARGFAAGGHEVLLWNIFQKSALDIFDEYKPTLFIGQTYNLERGLIKAIAENPECRVVMTGADWSKFSDELDLKKYPILVINKKELKAVEELKRLTGKPEFITAHYHQSRINTTHGHWLNNLGIPLLSVMPAADITDYTNSKELPEYKCDISMTGGYWGYKSQVISPWLFPLCNKELGLNIKLFGNKGWPVPQYCGPIDNSKVKHLFKSTKLNINLSEPHAQVFGTELNERVFKILAGKNMVLSDYTESLANDVFPDGVEYAKTPQEFKEKALAIIGGELSVDYEKGYEEVMNKHTYIHRAFTIFDSLGLEDEADSLINRYDEIREEYAL